MAILKRKQDSSPAALGAELNQARSNRDAVIAQAEADLQATRDSVIGRATQRIADLRAVEDEARTERLLTEEIVKQA